MNEDQPVIDPNVKLKSGKDVTNILFGFGVNSYNRFETFLKIAPKLKGRLYWNGLSNAYTNSDNLFEHRKEIRGAFESKEPLKERLMSFKEWEYLQELPSLITIYRGMTTTERDGLTFGVSWTLKRKVAEFYAETYNRNHDTAHLQKVVYEMVIQKKDVVAYMNGRKEHEIIYINPSG